MLNDIGNVKTSDDYFQAAFEIITCFEDNDGRKKMLLNILKTAWQDNLRNEIRRLRKNYIEIHNSKCDICGFDYSPVLHIHHIIPIKDYGDNSDNNIACLCPNCHTLVHRGYELINKEDTKSFDYFKEWISSNDVYKHRFELYRMIINSIEGSIKNQTIAKELKI